MSSSRELKCVKCTKVDRSTRNLVFVLVATFEDGGTGHIENCYVGKTLADLHDFRKSVIQLSADQENNSKSSHLLPDVKERKPLFTGKRDEKQKSTVDDFCQHVVKLSSQLLKDEMVVGFFRESSAPNEEGAIELLRAKDSSPMKKANKVGGMQQRLRETFRVDVKETLKVDSGPSTSSPSPSPTSPSPSVDLPAAAAAVSAAASKPSRLTSVEGTYAEIADPSPPSSQLVGASRPQVVSAYSEVKINEEETDVNAYAECVLPGNNSRQNHLESVTFRDRPGRPLNNEDALYASVFKGSKAMNPIQLQSTTEDEFYEDTSVFAPLKREEEDEQALYEDATSTASPHHHPHHHHQQQQQQPPTPPRPRGQSNTSEPDLKQAKPVVPSSSSLPPPGPSSSFNPLTPIPPMPQFPSPALLLNPDTLINGVSSGGVSGEGGGGEIQVVAIGDYKSSSDNVLSFVRGDLATLLLQSDSDWWCIRLRAGHGWVPAAYWRMLNSGDCVSLITRGNSPWFVGKLSRAECEALLMEHGRQQHFVVRESDSSGHYALSIKYDDRIHHFPIEVTADKKYNIGKHDFKTVNNIILYYQKNALFHDETGREVTLGSPLVIIKH